MTTEIIQTAGALVSGAIVLTVVLALEEHGRQKKRRRLLDWQARRDGKPPPSSFLGRNDGRSDDDKGQK